MPTVLQKRMVDSIVSQYADQHGLLPHKAFLYLVIEKYLTELELNSIDIEGSIVDGHDDCGIDAIVIDDESETHPQVYFFQSKYYEGDKGYEKNFEGGALDKLIQAVENFVLKGIVNSKYQNEALVDKLHSVINLAKDNPRYTLVFCSNSAKPTDQAQTKLRDFVKEINKGTGEEYVKIEYIDLDRLATELIAPPQQKRIDLSLQISGKFLTEDTGNVRLFLGAVEGSVLADLVGQYGDDLFERNVRGYLKKGNPINRQIIATASGKSSPYFIYMNNGVTMTCKKYSYSPLQNSPTLKLEDAQIVNGQQTVRSIFDAKKRKKLKEDVKVLVRIVETNEKEILSEIIEATNSQSKVTSRDLHSNDHVQKQIERSLNSLGYFYEARKNRYQGKEASKRIDAETCAQAYYAAKFEEPALAKDKKKQLFGEKYDELFHDKTNPLELLGCFLLLKKVQQRNNIARYSENYTFLKDATLHIVALVYKLLNSDFDKIRSIEDEEFDDLYETAINASDALVKEKSKEEGEKYEHRRTFKDPATFGRIVELMINDRK